MGMLLKLQRKKQGVWEQEDEMEGMIISGFIRPNAKKKEKEKAPSPRRALRCEACRLCGK